MKLAIINVEAAKIIEEIMMPDGRMLVKYANGAWYFRPKLLEEWRKEANHDQGEP